MDKKTILAIVLTVIVITISMFVQSYFFAPTYDDSTAQTQTTEQPSAVSETQSTETTLSYGAVSKGKNTSSEPFTYTTDLYTVTFDPAGASISSLVINDQKNADGENVDIVFRGENDHNAFLLYWGDDTKNPIVDNFAYTVEGGKVIFTNDYLNEKGEKFTIVKTFEFKDGEYLFAVTVDIIGDSGFSGISSNGYAYTLAYEPQVGPAFSQMKNSAYDYRRVYVDAFKNNGKLKKSMAKFNSSGIYTTEASLQWISVASKYFTVVALPQSSVAYKYTAVQGSSDNVAQTDSIYIARPATEASSSDTVYFYAGPQLKKYLGSYYSGMDNAWGLKNTDLDDAMDSSSMLGWLENILKAVLNLLYKIIPNYGVGIILLTLLLKILLWPLTKKSTDSTAKMQALQPQIQELQERYKDNPQKLNVAQAELFKENKVSPLGGCLPMLLQFPILIAFYGLLNKHFELRGAMFIPGWIPDLSVPETIFTLGFNLPFLGNEIHLLPILYTASMIFSMKMTSNAGPKDGPGSGTQKFMTYGMPILFFFILYSAPSGLLLYWFVQNILTMVQQGMTNNRIKKQPIGAKKEEKKEPEAVRKYQEKLKRLEEEKAKAEKANAKNKKK